MKKMVLNLVAATVAVSTLASMSFADVSDAQLEQLRQSTLTCTLVRVETNIPNRVNQVFEPSVTTKVVSYIEKGDPAQNIADHFCLPIPKDAADKRGLGLGGYSCFSLAHATEGLSGSVDKFNGSGLIMDEGSNGTIDNITIDENGDGEIQVRQHYGWSFWTYYTASVQLKDCSFSSPSAK